MHRLVKSLREQNSLYIENLTTIRQERRRLLTFLPVFAAVALALLYLISVAYHHTVFFVRPTVLLGIPSLLVLWLLSKVWTKPAAAAAFSYLLCLQLLVLAALLGRETRFFLAAYSATACLLPTLLLDRPVRKCIFFLSALFYIAVLFPFETPQALYAFLLAGLCATIAGLGIGWFTQRARLQDFSLIRQINADLRRDFLTKLSNRLRLFERISAEAEPPITAIYMIDIDNYKGFNDRYGHLAGDDCLRRIGAFCNRFGQTNHMEFFRYGGEEILALAFCHQADPEATARDIHDGIRVLGIPYEGTPDGVVSVSIGYSTGGSDYAQMIDQADQAMYRAKANGRNQIVSFCS